MKYLFSLITVVVAGFFFLIRTQNMPEYFSPPVERNEPDPEYFSPPVASDESDIVNPAIDMNGHLLVSEEAALHRADRRLSETEFIEMSQEPGVIILDARSSNRYEELHIEGAINLSFPDITIESLERLIPDKNTRILIYCNNNFFGAEQPFPSKANIAALNISTYITLYSYGYRNIYELGPLLDVNNSILSFEGSWLQRKSNLSKTSPSTLNSTIADAIQGEWIITSPNYWGSGSERSYKLFVQNDSYNVERINYEYLETGVFIKNAYVPRNGKIKIEY